jgi:SAM-dependent methyltransferase
MKGVKRSYQLFQAFRNEGTDPATFYRLLADDTVVDVSRYCQLVGATVLDVGGASGYVADAFRDVGSRSVTAEYDFAQMVEHGRRLVNGVAADGCALPFATGSVDVSYSSNVLEHVVSPQRMLAEMVRVVSPGGVVYLTFTNWLSPWGGHETSPWHYLGGEWAARRFRRLHGVPPKNRFGQNLFPLGVGQVLQWCQTRSDVTVVDTFPRYYPRWTKPVVRIPGLRELLTWNLVVVMRRTDGVPQDLPAG